MSKIESMRNKHKRRFDDYQEFEPMGKSKRKRNVDDESFRAKGKKPQWRAERKELKKSKMNNYNCN